MGIGVHVINICFFLFYKKMKAKKRGSIVRGGVGGVDRATQRQKLFCRRLATAIPCYHSNDRRVAIGMTSIVLDIGDPFVGKNLGLRLRMFDSSNVEVASILGTLVSAQKNEEGLSR